MKRVEGSTLPKPAGHYSPAIIHNGLVYVSGQLPKVATEQGEMIPPTIEEQTLQTLRNVEQILQAAGSDRTQVVRVTLYVSDIHLWAQVNQTYAEFFGDHRPARSIVPVGKFRNGAMIEIDVIAAVRQA
ncbi:MAG: RidA family protein [Pirellulales bacterium]